MPHSQNECCSDSLLQLLAYHGFVSKPFLFDVAARRQACRICRSHLVAHVNVNLRPRLRTSTGAVANASDAEHKLAHLQDDVHAEEIINCFFVSCPGNTLVPPEGMLVKVYTRWDSPVLPAHCNSVVVRRSILADIAQLEAPSIGLELCNNTGSGFTGYHYDPICPWSSTNAIRC